MIDSDRKLLTEWLGEKWYEHPRTQYCDGSAGGRCKITTDDNREFDTPDDFFVLKNRLVELGKWLPFFKQTWRKSGIEWTDTFVDWFINAERFPELVVRYLKEKK